MGKKSKSIVKHTVAKLPAMEKRSEAKTNWKAAAKRPLPSGRDPDDAMEMIDWVTTKLPMPRRNEHMALRIDADVLDWFRTQGKGYQLRINAILRRYFEQHAEG
jgi:uncharacterized protein (DUF4415 family)